MCRDILYMCQLFFFFTTITNYHHHHYFHSKTTIMTPPDLFDVLFICFLPFLQTACLLVNQTQNQSPITVSWPLAVTSHRPPQLGCFRRVQAELFIPDVGRQRTSSRSQAGAIFFFFYMFCFNFNFLKLYPNT